MKIFVGLALGAALAGGGHAVFSQQKQGGSGPQPGAKPQGMPVKAVPVKVGAVALEVSAVGTLLAEESVMIRPEIAGRIAAIHFKEGEPVAAGARLLTIDPAEYQAQLAGSTADAKLNAQRMERAEELYRKGFISSQALDEARSNLDRTAARQTEDRARLAKTEIRAPFAGIVGLRQVSPGAYVQPGKDIARLENIGSIKLDFRVPEVYLEKLGRDQEIALRVDAYPKDPFKGRIYALEPVVDEQTRTVLVRARIPNPGLKLRPGMFARVSLKLGSRDNALIVPEQAIVPKGQNTFVFRVVEGKAQLTRVQIGSRNSGEVEITEGVTAKDTVVTDGQIKLQDGMPVMILPNQPPTAAQSNGKG
ncbi:MAG: efflux RND transporter periplasmic adaptor subunit [Betaproteobacteria bacterium]|nr:efflux RND transporter periplasmic adaptor subunit [Betaproteobacteria bacterium]